MDKKQIAHDITIALLPKALSEVNIGIYTSNDEPSVESMCIVDTYREIYDSILEELSSRE